jgi:hypothetical protein
MKFSRKNSLSQHEKVHLGKYRCETCAKCFGRPNYLANHRRVCQKALGTVTIGNLPCSPIAFVHKVPSCYIHIDVVAKSSFSSVFYSCC